MGNHLTRHPLGVRVHSLKRVSVHAAACGAFFLYMSTDYVFDGRNPPYGEDDAPNPLNVYGRSKLEGERETLRHCPGNCPVSHLSVSPLMSELCVPPACPVRCGSPAGASSVWGGGDGVGERRDVPVAASPGGHRGQHFGSLSAEVPHRHPGRRCRLQEAVGESQTGAIVGPAQPRLSLSRLVCL